MFKRYISGLLLCIILVNCLGCWDKRELEDQAFVMSLAIDKGETCKFLWSFRIAIPRQMAGGQGGGGGGGGGKTNTVVSVEANTLFDALNLLNTFIDRKANMMHAKIVIIGEKLAKQGNLPLQSLIRYREIRRTLFVLVAKGKAKDIFLKHKPSLEQNPAKFFEEIAANRSYTGLSPKSQLHDFLMRTQSLDQQPVTMLVGLSRGLPKKKAKLQGDAAPYISGEVPRVGDTPTEVIGSAVFKDGKMVGTLTGSETRATEMVTGEFMRGFVGVPDPLVPGQFVSLDVKSSSPASIKADLVAGKPVINVTVNLEADLLAIQSDKDYTDLNLMKKLEQAASRRLEQEILRTIHKTQRLGTDIFGFGSRFKYLVATYDQWQKLNWKKRYPEAEVKVKVKMAIRRIGLNFNQPKMQ